MELIIVRHGETPGNAQRRYVGALDQPLSERGRQQAAAAGVHPEEQLVYVSTMRRARETAAIMFPNARQVAVQGVQEMDFGAFAGRTAEEMSDDASYRAWVAGNCEGRCPGGESREQFIERICAAIIRFCHELRERHEERSILVAHGGTIMASLHRLAVEERDYYDWLPGNCGGYRMDVVLADEDTGCVRFHNVREWGATTPHGRTNGPFPKNDEAR
jgi:alpha-ribazole phosphatase